MTAPRWRRWGWGKPYCNNLILWSLIVSCCFSLPDSVRWAYVKHISPLSVGALPASSNAAQRHKPWELLEADGPDNLPLGLQRQVRSQPERHRERERERETQAHRERPLAPAEAATTPHSTQPARQITYNMNEEGNISTNLFISVPAGRETKSCEMLLFECTSHVALNHMAFHKWPPNGLAQISVRGRFMWSFQRDTLMWRWVGIKNKKESFEIHF